MNNLQIFKNAEFGNIRIIEKDGKPYFCGSDVAKALGYVIPSKAVNTHCKGVSKMEVPTNGGVQQMLFIPEGDLYRLIAKSDLPSAEKFESWVFDEVLPSIRKTGSYTVPKEKPKRPALGSVNVAAKNIMAVYQAAGVDPRFTATAVTKLYEEMADIKLIPPIQVEPAEMIYDKTSIAKLLGIVSLQNLPHAPAIGAIISKIDVTENEMIKVPYSRRGHSGFDFQFKQSVIEKIKRWLKDNNYPVKIENNGKSYAVKYLQVA